MPKMNGLTLHAVVFGGSDSQSGGWSQLLPTTWTSIGLPSPSRYEVVPGSEDLIQCWVIARSFAASNKSPETGSSASPANADGRSALCTPCERHVNVSTSAPVAS